MQQPPHAVVRVLVAATAAALAFGAPCWAKVPPTTEPGQNVGYLTDQEIDKHRIEMNFRRAYDGHVALVSKKNGQYLDVKCDMQVPGTVLFRAPNGQVSNATGCTRMSLQVSYVLDTDRWLARNTCARCRHLCLLQQGMDGCCRLYGAMRVSVLVAPHEWCDCVLCAQVYYIAYASLKQVDLSDDQVVSALAQDDWEQNLQPIQVYLPHGWGTACCQLAWP